MKPFGLLAGTITLALAGAALAAWIPAVTVSEVDDFALLAQVALDGKGNAIVAWRGFDGTNHRARAAVIHRAFRRTGGTIDAAQTLSDAGDEVGGPFAGARIAVDRRGSATAIWYQSDGTNTRITVAVRPVGGTFGSAEMISDPGFDALSPRIAFDRKGNAVAVWQQTDGVDYRVRASFRSFGGTFGPAETLSASGGDGVGPEIAFDRNGNAIVVWARSQTTINGITRRIEFAVRPAGGTFGPAVPVTNFSDDSIDPEIAVDKHRNAILVWSEFIGSAYRVRTAFRPADQTFGVAQTLSAAGPDAEDAQIAFDQKGNAIAIWDRSDGSYQRVQAAMRPAGGAFTAAVTLSDPGGDALAPQLAFDTHGNAMAVWLRDDGTNARIQAALRPPGGAFGSAVTLSAPGDDGSFPQIVFNRGRNALAVWSVYEGGGSKVQAAVYFH